MELKRVVVTGLGSDYAPGERRARLLGRPGQWCERRRPHHQI